MSGTRSKRHHYIPQFLIRNWADETGKVWVYNQYTQRIFLTSPSNIFAKSHLYAYQSDLESAKNDVFEKIFSREEKRVSKILRRIIATIRSGQPEILNPEEALQCRLFLISMARRTPESQSRLRGFDGDPFLEAVKRLPEARSMGLDDPEVLYRNAKVREMKKMVESNVNAVFASGTLPRDRKKAFAHAQETCMLAMHVKDPRHSFLLGSHGYSYTTDVDENGNSHVSAWLPIAPDVAIALTDWPEDMNVSHFEDQGKEKRFARVVNESTLVLSKCMVSTNKQLLKNLRRQYGGQAGK